MTALATLVEPLKRELAVPGLFADAFPSTVDDDLQASLADAFAEAQLYGFFPKMTLAETNADFETSDVLSAAGGALILIFAATRIIRSQLRTLATMEKYKAGPVEFEIQHAATVLTAELAYLKATLDDLIAQGRFAANSGARLATVFDNYVARTSIQLLQSLGGSPFYPYELAFAIPFELWSGNNIGYWR